MQKIEQERIDGVEIGCLYGDGAKTILESNPRIYLISIDPFIANSPGTPADMVGDEATVLEKLKEYLDRFSLIVDYSWNVVGEFADDSLDFLFIDGDHSRPSVQRDFNDWVPKIKGDGLLFIHDVQLMDGPIRIKEQIENSFKWEVVDATANLVCARKIVPKEA